MPWKIRATPKEMKRAGGGGDEWTPGRIREQQEIKTERENLVQICNMLYIKDESKEKRYEIREVNPQ